MLKQNEMHKSLLTGLLTEQAISALIAVRCTFVCVCVCVVFLGHQIQPHPVFLYFSVGSPRCVSGRWESQHLAVIPHCFRFSLSARFFFLLFFSFITIICFSTDGSNSRPPPRYWCSSRTEAYESFSRVFWQNKLSEQIRDCLMCHCFVFYFVLFQHHPPTPPTPKNTYDLILYFAVSPDSPRCVFWSGGIWYVFVCLFFYLVCTRAFPLWYWWRISVQNQTKKNQISDFIELHPKITCD